MRESSKPALFASIRHLKVFESVAQLHGVQRASEEVHRSQPAVTYAIAKLEKQLGVTLLVRRPSGSYLNGFGVIFQRRIRRMSAQLDQAIMQLGISNSDASANCIASSITRSQVRSLVAVVENGSFAKAARVLGISQAQLQRAARNLERMLRAPLYLQTASGIIATPAAVDLARKLKLALREVEMGVEEIEAARGNIGGEIVIGGMLMAGSVVLASVLNEFVAAYPQARVRVLNGNAEGMHDLLRCGDVDFVIGLIRHPAPSYLVNEPLAETPYVVVGRHGHPLTERRSATLEDIAACDWVVGTPGAHRRTRFDQLFSGRRRPSARIETCSLPVIRQLLAQSDRLTLLTSCELMYEDELLAEVPFGPIDPVPVIGLTMRENWLPTPLQVSFLELVRKRIGGSLVPTDGLNVELRNMGLSLQDYTRESR